MCYIRGWAPPPLRPMVAQPMVRESREVVAAVCPQRGPGTAWLVPEAQSERLTRLLTHVAAALADYGMVRLVARAGGHWRHQGTRPDTMRVLPQPPGRPVRKPAAPLGGA